MKELLIITGILLSAYLFGNFYDYQDARIRNFALQLNDNRSRNPQAICNLLHKDAVIVINDHIPQKKWNFEGNKTEGCQYLEESAQFVTPPPANRNNFLPDIFGENFNVNHQSILYPNAEISFSLPNYSEPLRKDKNRLLVGSSSTKIVLRRRLLGGFWIERYEFNRKASYGRQ